MSLRILTEDFRTLCPLRDRKGLARWASARGRAFFRTQTYADIAAGRPAQTEQISLVLAYLLDQCRDNREALRFAEYLDARKIPHEERSPHALLDIVSLPVDDPFAGGMSTLHDFASLCRNPLHAVAPCSSPAQVCEAATWLFVDAGRRIAGHPVSECEAIERCAGFMHSTFSEYVDHLVAWWRHAPWSIAVGGESPDFPSVASITLPLSHEQYSRARSGRVEVFRELPGTSTPASAHLFAEGLGRRPQPPRTLLPARQLVHLFRTVICQQAALSDVPHFGDSVPLRVLAPSCFDEITHWMRRIGYKPVGSTLPVSGFNLWERIAWDAESGFHERAQLGIWRFIQWRLRERSEPHVNAGGPA